MANTRARTISAVCVTRAGSRWSGNQPGQAVDQTKPLVGSGQHGRLVLVFF
jgi:hypothetical protein